MNGTSMPLYLRTARHIKLTSQMPETFGPAPMPAPRATTSSAAEVSQPDEPLEFLLDNEDADFGIEEAELSNATPSVLGQIQQSLYETVWPNKEPRYIDDDSEDSEDDVGDSEDETDGAGELYAEGTLHVDVEECPTQDTVSLYTSTMISAWDRLNTSYRKERIEKGRL